MLEAVTDRLMMLVAEDTARVFREYPNDSQELKSQVELLALRAKGWLGHVTADEREALQGLLVALDSYDFDRQTASKVVAIAGPAIARARTVLAAAPGGDSQPTAAEVGVPAATQAFYDWVVANAAQLGTDDGEREFYQRLFVVRQRSGDGGGPREAVVAERATVIEEILVRMGYGALYGPTHLAATASMCANAALRAELRKGSEE